jgi:hypothetical protein
MMVSPIPFIVSALLVGVPLFAFLTEGRRAFVLATIGSILVLVSLLLWAYVPGLVLRVKAGRGDSAAMFELARWTENHNEALGSLILWPFGSDVLGGYDWLEKAAARDYPPALWLVGVRLKHGIHVPQPAGWKGAGGNVFPQPERGQKLIDRAKELGYHPPADEEGYYWQHYRR